ncbi:NADH-specific methylglyoxal reductase [Planctomycetales bacterium 10988]|nr:NADH-specific methylglyoxal reductase [Planctomycetales bacterium 10988]
METRRLGRTDLQISRLSVGGLFTSSLAGGEQETRRILEQAIDFGINAIDTAPAYADSEATLGKALKGLNSPLILSTKLGGRPQPFDPQSAAGLRSSVEESLRLLGRDSIDILHIHEPDRPQQYSWWTSYDPLEGPVLDVMRELKERGLVRFFGLGGTTVTELTALMKTDLFDVVLTAFNYNALFREAATELLPTAAQLDMGVFLGSTLGQGFLARRHDKEVQQRPIWLSKQRQEQLLAYYRLLDESGLSPVELCLRFAMGHLAVSTIPVGCKTMEHLKTSVAAVEKGPLPADVLNRLDEIAAMVPFRPYEEPMILPLGKNYYGPGPANVGASVPVGQSKKLEQ